MDKEKTFQELAGEFSDCSSAKRGGDLGPFGRNQMQVNVLSIYGQRQTIMAKYIKGHKFRNCCKFDRYLRQIVRLEHTKVCSNCITSELRDVKHISLHCLFY